MGFFFSIKVRDGCEFLFGFCGDFEEEEDDDDDDDDDDATMALEGVAGEDALRFCVERIPSFNFTLSPSTL